MAQSFCDGGRGYQPKLKYRSHCRLAVHPLTTADFYIYVEDRIGSSQEAVSFHSERFWLISGSSKFSFREIQDSVGLTIKMELVRTR
jgi:hypothetical protein